MRVNMNKTKVMISGELQKVTQKAVRWPCGVCVRGIGNIMKTKLIIRLKTSFRDLIPLNY